jgi:hypothetical protein
VIDVLPLQQEVTVEADRNDQDPTANCTRSSQSCRVRRLRPRRSAMAGNSRSQVSGRTRILFELMGSAAMPE